MAAERGRQREELPRLEFEESGSGVGLEKRQQAFQVEHGVLIDHELAGRLQPLVGRGDGERQRPRRASRDDAEWFALGPLAACVDRFELLQQLETLDGFREDQRRVLGWACQESRASVDQARQGGPFETKVAMRLDGLAVTARKHRCPTLAGLEADVRLGNRLHQQGDGETGLEGFETNPGLCVGLDVLGARHGPRGALHADLGDERGHGLQEPSLAVRRELDALGRDDVEQPAVVGGESGDLDAVVRRQGDAVLALGIPAMGFDGDLRHAVLALIDAQFGFPANDFDGLSVRIEDVRVTGQRIQAAITEQVIEPSPGAAHGDRGGGRQILFAQVVHGFLVFRQALQGDGPALAPGSVLVAALFAGTHVDLVGSLHDFPGETLLDVGCGGLAALFLGVVGKLFQCLQRALPHRKGFLQLGQGPGAERLVQRSRVGQIGEIGTAPFGQTT